MNEKILEVLKSHFPQVVRFSDAYALDQQYIVRAETDDHDENDFDPFYIVDPLMGTAKEFSLVEGNNMQILMDLYSRQEGG